MPIKLKDGRVIPTLEEHAGARPTASDPQFKKNNAGSLTAAGRAALESATKAYEPKENQWNKLYGKLIENEGNQGDLDTGKQNDLNAYTKSPEGQNMDLYKNLAFLSGVPSTALNYTIGKTAPAGVGMRGRLAKLLPYASEAAVAAGIGRVAESKQPNQLDNPAGYDRNQLVQNALYGYTSGPVIAGLHKAFGTYGEAPEGNNTGGGAGGNPPPPGPNPIDLKGKSPTAASEAILDKLGVKPGKTLTENRGLIDQALKSASPEVRADIAASHASFDPANLRESVGKRLSYMRPLSFTGPVALGLAGAGLGDAATSDAQASGLDDRESNALGNLARVGGAGAGVATGYALDRGMGAAGRGLNALADAIPENALSRAISYGARGASRLLGPAGYALAARDLANSDVHGNEGPNGEVMPTGPAEFDKQRLQMNALRNDPDIGARLRADAQNKQQIENAFRENRQAYSAPTASINPNEVPNQPVFSPGSPFAPGSQGMPRGAAYADLNGSQPQMQTQAPPPIQKPQSIPTQPQEAQQPMRAPPKVPDDYQPGPAQRAQEKALREEAQRRVVQNQLALQGPDAPFYRALAEFQSHFGGAR